MHPSWQNFLKQEFQTPYFVSLAQFLHQAYDEKTIYPPKKQVFRAFSTDLNKIKVVILGQDPYHEAGQANGLAFSVSPSLPLPPSLRNIFLEIQHDLNKPMPTSGDLSRWAKQGVLLLNSSLTVEAHLAGSHRGRGWEIFTDHVISYLNKTRPHLVFLLWGNAARAKAAMIDQEKHYVLTAAHPSPLSASRGFFGCRHFSKTNAKLRTWGLPAIDW